MLRYILVSANAAKYSPVCFFLIKKENLCTKRVGVWALCEREGRSKRDTVKIDGGRVCLQEKKKTEAQVSLYTM